MIWLNLKRIIRSGFIGFWRSGYVSIASVLVLAVTLFFVGALMLSSAFLNSALESVKERVDISVSFKLDAPEKEILALKSSLELLPEITTVTYTSREKELANFQIRHRDNTLLIQSLSEVGNPFGARLSITASDPSH